MLLAAAALLHLARPLDRAAALPPAQDPADRAAALLSRLTPEERVGQLFLLTFRGQSVDPNTPIYDLIWNHHIGGVVLRADHDNITAPESSPETTIRSVEDLTARLQQTEWDSSQIRRRSFLTAAEYTTTYVPLLIAIAQEGDGYPYDQIYEGLTTLPSQMALGATWTPDLAAEAGRIQGEQLSRLGFNLLLGPLLDVLDPPRIEATSTLSTRTFGGDPFWVGRMGQAYIRGVHRGSAGQMAVVASHFPGHGASDRLPEEEVATVRKSLDELISFDLAPFLAVTGSAPSAEETTDALLTSHIRYQGLQGNIRASTRPVSFDPQALALLLDLPGLDAWRSGGGLLISDDLGNAAVRRFYDLTSQTFDARRVALNAFLAGNDLLYIADFSSSSAPDSYSETLRTLEFFTQKYGDDAAFAARVDESVLRILSLKLRIVPGFDAASGPPAPPQPQNTAPADPIIFSIAQEAATLLSPSQADLDVLVPDPPNQNDRIVFITDTRSYAACSSCPPEPKLRVDALQNAVIRLYGPQGGGQVGINNLSSYPLEDLQKLLNRHPDREALTQSLERAGWIIFSMLGDRPNSQAFETLRQFLNEQPNLFQQKRVIVFAFTAPYYLDATDISKLTAYYALYSRAGPFVDVAAYLLFGELRPAGAPPVSVPGINYNLSQALQPDPGQTIPLAFDLASTTPLTATVTPEPAQPPEFRIGDLIPIRTGVILDRNRRPVPDGTPVDFNFSLAGEATTIRQTELTRSGIARTTFSVSAAGALEIRAEAETARSAILRIDIPAPGGSGALTQTPGVPTPEPSPTPSEAPPTETAPPPTEATGAPTAPPPSEAARLGLSDWLLAVTLSILFGAAVYRMAALIGQIGWGVRAGFMALIGGLMAYSYLAWTVSNAEAPAGESLLWNVFFSALGGGLIGALIALGWRYIAMLSLPPAQLEPGSRTPPFRPAVDSEAAPASEPPAADSAQKGERQADEQHPPGEED